MTYAQPTLANSHDAAALQELRDHAARWQASRGIEQWHPGDVDVATFEAQIDLGQWWLVRDETQVLASIRLIWDDIPYWGPQPPVAGYVHGLVARPETPGTKGLGAGLIRWAETRIFEAGRSVARLDCVATNEPLKAYYRSHGYRDVRVATPQHLRYPVQLFEKQLVN